MNLRNLKLVKSLFIVTISIFISTVSFGQDIDVVGLGNIIPDGDITPSLTDSTDFGDAIVATSVSDTFRVHNSDATNLSIFGVSITGTDASMFAVTTSPVSPVLNGDSTDLVITFTPTSSGLKTATVNIFSNDNFGKNPYEFDIQGNGVSSQEIDILGNAISIAAGDMIADPSDDTDFGDVTTSAGSDMHTFTINNTGDDTLFITSVTLASGTDFVVTNFADTILGLSSDTFDITFDPLANGPAADVVTIVSNDGDEGSYAFQVIGNGVTDREIDIQGLGVSIPDGSAAPNLLDDTDFGAVTTSSGTIVKTFTVLNTGEEDLSFDAVTISGVHAPDFTLTSTHSFSETITGVSSTTFDITFDPSVNGDRFATITVQNDDADEDPYTFDIKGNGIPDTEIEIQGNFVPIADGDVTPVVLDNTDFGTVNVGGNTANTFKVHNGGSPALDIYGTSITGPDASMFVITTAPVSPVNLGDSTDFIITFSPTSSGLKTATVTIFNSDGDEGTYNYEIQGNGLNNEMDVTGLGVSIADGANTPNIADDTDFGGAAVAVPIVHTFTIENLNAGPILNITSISISGINAGDFVVTSNPSPTAIAGSGNTTFDITFTPGAVGLRLAEVSIVNDDEDENPYNFTIQGNGLSNREIDVVGNFISIVDGDVTPSTTDDTDFGSVSFAVGSILKTFTIENTGGQDLTVTNIVIGGAQSAEFVLSGIGFPAVITGGGTTTFNVTFDPIAAGLRQANITISNDDANENPYTYDIQGTGTAASEYTMSSGTSGSTYTECIGTIFDDGGPSGQYLANKDYTYTLAPTDANQVAIVFNSFDIEYKNNCGYDYLDVDYGATTVRYCNSGPGGGNPPVIGQTYYSDPGQPIILTWHSDGGLEENGFDIDWEGIITGSATSSNISCNGLNDGVITLNTGIGAGNGTGAYTYDLDGGGFGVPNSWNTLNNTAHTVTIRDVNGCTYDTTITISEPSILVASEVHNDETCAGSADGSITISGSGGIGPYDYSFNGSPYTGTATYNGIGVGSFPGGVMDANGCITPLVPNVTFNIGGTGAPTGVGSMTGDDFFCLADSTIKSYTISGITNASTYTWQLIAIGATPLPTIISGQGTSTLLLQMAGVTDSIFVKVTPSNACGNGTSDSIRVVPSNFPIPVTFNMTPITINVGAAAVDLTLTVNQPGGLFGGTGVIPANDEFDPSIAGTGAWTLSYDIDDPNGCHHTLTDIVTVVTNLGVVTVAPTMCHDGGLEFATATPSPSFTIGSIIGFNIDGNPALVNDTILNDYTCYIDPSLQTKGSHALNFRFVTLEFVQVPTTPIFCTDPGVPPFIPPSVYQCGWNYTTVTVPTTQAITQNFYVDSIGGINIISSIDSACTDQTNLANFVAQYFHLNGLGFWTCPATSFNVVNSTFATINPSVAGSGGSPYPIYYEYTSTENGSGCKAYDTTQFIVHPLPTPSFTLNPYYSELDPPFNTNPIPNGIPSGDGNFTGLGMSNEDFYPNLAGAGGHRIVYWFQDTLTGCSNSVWDSTFVIAHTGSISGLSPTYCYGDPVVNISGMPNVGFGLSGSVVGTFSVGVGTNPAAVVNTGNNVGTFDPSLAGQGWHDIIFSYVDQVPFTETVSVFVDSIGVVNFTGLNASHDYCVIEPQLALNALIDHPNGGTGGFSWASNLNTLIDAGNTAYITPDSVGTFNITLTYTSTLENSGCTVDTTETINVYALPILSFTVDPGYCSNDSNITFVGAPAGGTFSGPAITSLNLPAMDSVIFQPYFSPIGANTISYDYTDAVGCSNRIDTIIQIYQAPTAQIDAAVFLEDYCELSGLHPVTGLINGSNINQGYFWGNGIFDNDSTDGYADFWPDSATVGGPYTLSYFYTDVNGCSDTAFAEYNVNPLPIMSLSGFSLNKAYCNNHDILLDPVTFVGAPPITSGLAGTFVLDGVVTSADQSSFDPTSYPSNLQDTVIMSYTHTDLKGCINVIEDTVYVNPAAHPDFTISGICIVDSIDFTDVTTVTPDGFLNWTWSIDDSTYTTQNATHQFTVDGNHFVNFEITTNSLCTSDTSAIIEFGDKPTADFYWINECFDPLVPIMFFDTSATASQLDTLFYNWDFDDGIGTSTSQDTNYFYATPGDYNVELAISTAFNCVDTIVKLVSVKPLITTYPYFTDFESGPDSWTAKTIIDFDTLQSWGHSTWMLDPAPTNLSWSTSHLLDSSDYNSNERSYVSSPCFDFTTLEKPMMKFLMWRDFADIGDGVVVESSIDNGQTWQVIGLDQSVDPGINWYNQIVINNGDGPGGDITSGQPLGWSDIVDPNWIEVRHDLDHLIGNAKVIFRVAFSANAAGENKGFAFDNVWIGERSKFVLVENFTNTSCGACAAQNVQLNPFLNDYRRDLIDIQYHTNAIAGDQLYTDYQAGPSTRELYYGASLLPQTITDGNILNLATNLWLQDSLITRRRALTTGIFDIDIVKTVLGSNYTIDATITINTSFSNDIDVYIAAVEKQIDAQDIVNTGGAVLNGEVSVYNVVKAMLPDAGGTRISQTWNMGDSQLISESWNSTSTRFYGAGDDDLEFVVFVQDATTKEVYQTFTTDTSFINITVGEEDLIDDNNNPFSYNLYPNPTDGNIFLMFNQDVFEETNIAIYNELGSLVEERNISNGIGTSFSTDNYPNGIYFMSVVYKGERFTKRFMVMR